MTALLLKWAVAHWKQMLIGLVVVSCVVAIFSTVVYFHNEYVSRGVQVEADRVTIQNLKNSLTQVSADAKLCSDNTLKLKAEQEERQRLAQTALDVANATAKVNERSAQALLALNPKTGDLCKEALSLFKLYTTTYPTNSKEAKK